MGDNTTGWAIDFVLEDPIPWTGEESWRRMFLVRDGHRVEAVQAYWDSRIVWTHECVSSRKKKGCWRVSCTRR